ncbi:MAG: ATP-binding cassette domain-containing protein [Oscillospiraceae bacterium]|nr:ATP-binding cassette domain-containing protein [Oscillospiraceae bacterium]
MKAYEKIPNEVIASLSEKGISESDILLCVRSDMSRDASYCDCYAVLTNDAIATLAVSEGIARNDAAPFFTLKRIKPILYEYGFEYYPLDELRDLKITEYISSGRLSARAATPEEREASRKAREEKIKSKSAESVKKDPDTIPPVPDKPAEQEKSASADKPTEPEKPSDRISILYFTNIKKDEILTFIACADKVREEGSFPDELAEKNRDQFCPKCGNRYPDPDKKICPKCMDKGKLVKKLLPFFSRYRKQLLLVFLTIIITTGMELLSPYIGGKIFYDEVLSTEGSMYGQIGLVLIIMIGTSLLSSVFQMINGIINARITASVTYDLKKTIFACFGRLSLAFFTGRQTGGLMTQVNGDANTLYWFFCDGFPYLCSNIIKLIGIIVLLCAINLKLTLMTLLPIPIFIALYRIILMLFEKLYARNYSKYRAFNSIVADVLSGMRIVKAFSRESVEIKRFDKKSRDYSDSNVHISKIEYTVFPLLYFLMNLGSYLIFIFGGWYVIRYSITAGVEGISYGTFMLFLSYMNIIYGPLGFLSEVSGWWARCINAIQRLFEILEAKADVEESASPAAIDGGVKGRIEFKNVGFSYIKNKKTIDNVSFTVEPGKTLGIVGHTGAGKSTLANLLTRLYDASEGEILIDGVNIKNLSFKELHDSIAIVSQETYLFRGTILDNIRYARPDATYDEVIAASKAAGAHGFIIKYPDGYDTMVGMDYKGLSGGERQRVSIARAILKNPTVLILDEATAAMDTQTERMIQAALSEITKGKTTIIIAHRLSTLRDADNLIVIENGKMTESGTHTELLLKKGTYSKLYKLQLEALKTIGINE